MGRAAAGRAEGASGALEELRFHWGSAYDVDLVGGMWTASRKDGGAARSPIRPPEGCSADPD
jgi:hypothetical protein